MFVNLNSHCVEIDGKRVLVLGCHDLNMFSPRGWKSQKIGGERRTRCENMRRIARKFKPTTVIQHAHQSDSYRIWLAAWSGLRTQLPTVQQGVTGFAYFPLGEEERQDLPTVLERTKFGPQIEDVIVKGYR